VGVPSFVRLAMRYPISYSVSICNRVLEWMDAHEDSLPICRRKQRCCNLSVAQLDETNLRRQYYYLKCKTYNPPDVRALLHQIFQQRTNPGARLARRKILSCSTMKCKEVLEWMDSHDGRLPVCVRYPTTDAQRAAFLLRNRFWYLRSKTKKFPELRLVFEHIEICTSFVSGTTTCKKVLEWMYGHEMLLPQVATCNPVLKWMNAYEGLLPLFVEKFPSVAQRAENLLRRQFQYLKSKSFHPPEVRVLLDQISQQLPPARLARRKLLSSATTKCKKVLEWMDAHDGNLPVLLRHATTDAQRGELLLRRQFNYLGSKTKSFPELRAVYEHIDRRMAINSGTTICKKVLDWMYGHEMMLPKEFRKPITDAHRVESLLRNQFKYLSRKLDQPLEVCALLNHIQRLSASTSRCQNESEWMGVHEVDVPVLSGNPSIDAQRAERFLRKQLKYLRSKTCISSDLLFVVEQIESCMLAVFVGFTCKEVFEWMTGHELPLPNYFRRLTTDAERAEDFLRNHLNVLKSKIDQSHDVLALFDQIKCLSLQVFDMKQWLTVPPFLLSSEDSLACELRVFKRRRLLVKTKFPAVDIDSSVASTVERTSMRSDVGVCHV
jgi:hypothetical protein